MLIGYKTQRVPANLRIYPDILGFFLLSCSKSLLFFGKPQRREGALESALVNQVNKMVMHEKIPVEQKDWQLIPKIFFERINPLEFYGELTNLN